MYKGPPSVHDRPWPTWDELALEEDNITYPIQVNGKIRGSISVSSAASEETIREAALTKVKFYVQGKKLLFLIN